MKSDRVGPFSGMSVSVTLVFACEAHREEFLIKEGFLDKEGQKQDYEIRRNNSNLYFMVPCIEFDGENVENTKYIKGEY